MATGYNALEKVRGAQVGPSHGNVAQSQRPPAAPGHGDDREITRIANAAADDHVAGQSAPFLRSRRHRPGRRRRGHTNRGFRAGQNSPR